MGKRSYSKVVRPEQEDEPAVTAPHSPRRSESGVTTRSEVRFEPVAEEVVAETAQPPSSKKKQKHRKAKTDKFLRSFSGKAEDLPGSNDLLDWPVTSLRLLARRCALAHNEADTAAHVRARVEGFRARALEEQLEDEDVDGHDLALGEDAPVTDEAVDLLRHQIKRRKMMIAEAADNKAAEEMATEAALRMAADEAKTASAAKRRAEYAQLQKELEDLEDLAEDKEDKQKQQQAPIRFLKRARRGGLEGGAGNRDQGVDGLSSQSVESARRGEREQEPVREPVREPAREPEMRDPAEIYKRDQRTRQVHYFPMLSFENFSPPLWGLSLFTRYRCA